MLTGAAGGGSTAQAGQLLPEAAANGAAQEGVGRQKLELTVTGLRVQQMPEI
jgi:hypothetical protein